MGELSNFCGHVVDLIRTDSSLSIRLLSWNALDEGVKPALTLSLTEYGPSSNNTLTLEIAKDKEYEIDSVELESERLQLWISGFDRPIEIKSKSIKYQFEDLTEADLRGLLKISRTSNGEKYKQIILLRNKIDTIAKFIDESESRLTIKSQSHPEGTDGYRIYKEQFKLLHRLRVRLNAEL